MTHAQLSQLLQTPRRLHFIGVGGSGMFPLVQILLAAGHTLQGSDTGEGSIQERERALGVTVFKGHDARNVQGADLVVFSAAIPANNPERLAAAAAGIPCIERSVMLGFVASLYRRPLCIAGTHGKTTATGMATQILEMAGKNPAAVIGGKLPLIDGYGKAGSGDVIVVEACEYHNTFLELRPHTAVLLNVDDDHLEFFGSMQGLRAAFAKFCRLATHTVLYNLDDENTRAVIGAVTGPTPVSFGIEAPADYRAAGLHMHAPGCWAFTVHHAGQPLGEVRLSAPGRHNVYNALAAYAGAHLLGATHEECAAGLAAFGGTGRRFEVLGRVRGFTVADDYAHHPTELRAILSTAAQMGYNRVWAVFQPYTFSRTQMLLEDFAAVLPLADRVVMTAIMGGREQARDYPGLTTAALAEKIPGAVWFETQAQVAAYILENAGPGDLVLTLGCGDIYKCANLLLQTGTA